MDVTVRPMSGQEFERWQEHAVVAFADDLVRSSGMTTEAALARAQSLQSELLPDGLDTEKSWLLRILTDQGLDVGMLWIGPHPYRSDTACIYDIEIEDSQQGRGFGRAAMLRVEKLVREAGITEIALTVFGFNERARRLYDSLNYRVVSTQMLKTLEPDS